MSKKVTQGAENTSGAGNATGAEKTPSDGFVLLGTFEVGAKVAAFLKSNRTSSSRSWADRVCLYARDGSGCATDAVPPFSVGLAFTDAKSAFFVPFSDPDEALPEFRAFVNARDHYAKRFVAGTSRIVFDSVRFESGALLRVLYNPSREVARLEVRFRNGVEVCDVGADGLDGGFKAYPDILSVVPSTREAGAGLLASFDASRLSSALAILSECVGERREIVNASFLSQTAAKPCTILAHLKGRSASAVVMPLGEARKS